MLFLLNSSQAYEAFTYFKCFKWDLSNDDLTTGMWRGHRTAILGWKRPLLAGGGPCPGLGRRADLWEVDKAVGLLQRKSSFFGGFLSHQCHPWMQTIMLITRWRCRIHTTFANAFGFSSQSAQHSENRNPLVMLECYYLESQKSVKLFKNFK